MALTALVRCQTPGEHHVGWKRWSTKKWVSGNLSGSLAERWVSTKTVGVQQLSGCLKHGALLYFCLIVMRAQAARLIG